MASYEQFKTFAKTHKLGGAGLYVIQPNNQPLMPIKVGYSGRLTARLAQYEKSMPWGFKVLGVARVAARTAPSLTGEKRLNPVQEAEKLMLEILGPHVEYKKEWMDGRFRNKILNAWAAAHHKYSANGPLGTHLFTSEHLVANERGNPGEYVVQPVRRVVGKQSSTVLPLRREGGQPPFRRLVRVIDEPPEEVRTLRRSIRIAAKNK
jgi:hypothetical protein